MSRDDTGPAVPLLGLGGLFCLLLSAGPAWAQETLALKAFAPYRQITGELRGRVELNNFFWSEPAVTKNNDYVFGATRARLGLGLTTFPVDGFVQLEHTALTVSPTTLSPRSAARLARAPSTSGRTRAPTRPIFTSRRCTSLRSLRCSACRDFR